MLEVNILLLEQQESEIAEVREVIQSLAVLGTYKIIEVGNINDFLKILDLRLFDLVIADYKIIAKCIPLCLEIVQRIGIPLICLSGCTGEEVAVEMMRQGATDYILKTRLDLLPAAIKRALESRLTLRANTLQHTLAMITLRLHHALDLDELLHTAVSEVQQCLKADRVILYRQDVTSHSIVIAEAILQPEWSLIGKSVPDIGIAQEKTWLERGHVHSMADIYTTPLPTDHMCLLLDAQVRASLTVAIPQGEKVWGFLAVHSCQLPRRWQLNDLELLERLSTQIAISIHQVSLMDRSLQSAQGKKDAEAKAAHLENYDLQTGLPNRNFFIETLNQYLTAQLLPFVILLLDLDRFKTINDRFGNAAGDQLLKIVARRLLSCVPSPDIVSRLQGDKFAILRLGTDKIADVQTFAETIMAELAKPIFLDHEEIFLSVSIGIIASTSAVDTVDDLLRDAEIALQRSKANGRGQYVFFEAIMREQFMLRMQLIADLRQAADRGELYLLYQPIHSLSLQKITGLEALLRWQHPHRGVIYPGEFITLAEEAGLIIPIGNWVIAQVCRQLQLWYQKFPDLALSVSVNVSVTQLEETGIVDTITAILAETQLPPGSLKLEITESVLMKDLDNVRTRLNEIQSMGVEISIDDFGTGYSSFSYLQSLPVNVLKIDQSFIGQLDINGNTNQIVEAIVTLAHKLGLQVVAEGVETSEQLRRFSAMGNDHTHVQGFLISRPLTTQGVEELLLQQS